MLWIMDRVLLLMTATSYKAGAYLDAARRLGLAVTVGSDRPQALAEMKIGRASCRERVYSSV